MKLGQEGHSFSDIGACPARTSEPQLFAICRGYWQFAGFSAI
ncbi:hypothetical protein CES86_2111 [Brucella lupini]|uniref:Uncharacterized protein n=1 Tax=Brucella lupini TaxID=255457 RepID=A0A256GRD6_9HYPH|nr:hypothetical protein CES86_2111 [Brucella lupini]